MLRPFETPHPRHCLLFTSYLPPAGEGKETSQCFAMLFVGGDVLDAPNKNNVTSFFTLSVGFAASSPIGGSQHDVSRLFGRGGAEKHRRSGAFYQSTYIFTHSHKKSRSRSIPFTDCDAATIGSHFLTYASSVLLFSQKSVIYFSAASVSPARRKRR